MAGADLPDRAQSGPKDEVLLQPRKRRLGVRVDMTPMVDVAFLLLIFFMVTTVFRRPLAMEVNLPEPGARVQVPESNVMTVYVRPDDAMFYRVGRAALARIGWDELAATFKERSQANKELIILVKISRDTRYERMVDMMDTLEDAHMQRFSVVPMTSDDQKTVAGLP